MIANSVEQEVYELEMLLRQRYPMAAMLSSKGKLWRKGAVDKLITQEQYTMACNYYGELWNRDDI